MLRLNTSRPAASTQRKKLRNFGEASRYAERNLQDPWSRRWQTRRWIILAEAGAAITHPDLPRTMLLKKLGESFLTESWV